MEWRILANASWMNGKRMRLKKALLHIFIVAVRRPRSAAIHNVTRMVTAEHEFIN